MRVQQSHPCWVCGSTATVLERAGVRPDSISPRDFRITDAAYGTTGDLYRCGSCGFRFCPGMSDVLSMYEQMSDPEYDATREARALQASKLLHAIARFRPTGRLLDVGAGSGILVERAAAMGYQASGVEPSKALQALAAQRGIPVLPGVLADHTFEHGFDVVSLVDVIEHVESPAVLVRESVSTLSEQGVLVVITPDVNSLMARMLGRRWWHFRIAHIGYFNRNTLSRLLEQEGLEVMSVTRPGWYFPASYLFERCMQYLPQRLRVPAPAFLNTITVPLNLFDSLMMVCRRRA